MSIVLVGSTSGSITLQEPAVAGTTVLTLPAVSGTIITTGSSGGVSQAMLATGVAGTGPTFLAYQTTVQSVANATNVKINFDTEVFDTNNNFDVSNGRFTPTVAGYYQINLSISLQSLANTVGLLFKNGSHYLTFVTTGIAGISNTTATTSCVVSMNGSTDYLEGYVYQGTGGAVNSNNDSRFMQFSGSLIRSA